MKVTKLSLLVLAIATSVGTANANDTVLQTFAKPAGIGIEAGTLGYGANISWGVTESTELQVGWNGGKLDTDVDIGDNDSIINWNKALGDDWGDYKGNLKLEVKGDSPYIGIQNRPFKNAFTIGTGVIVPNQDITASLVTNGTSNVKANGVSYTLNAGDTVDIHAEPKNKLAPYLTLGVRPNINSRFGLSAEIGAAYVGGYKVNVDSPNTALAADIKKEIDADDVKWYPIAKIGATIRF